MVAYRGKTRESVSFPASVREMFVWQHSGSGRVVYGGVDAHRETHTLTLREGDVVLLSRERCGGVDSVWVETESEDDVLIVSTNTVRFPGH